MRNVTVSTSYENGRRIEVHHLIYEKSDDLFTLANLYRRREVLARQLEEAEEGESTENLREEIASLDLEITAQESVVSGYNTESNAEN